MASQQLTDRQLKLRNYHARKVAERRSAVQTTAPAATASSKAPQPTTMIADAALQPSSASASTANQTVKQRSLVDEQQHHSNIPPARQQRSLLAAEQQQHLIQLNSRQRSLLTEKSTSVDAATDTTITEQAEMKRMSSSRSSSPAKRLYRHTSNKNGYGSNRTIGGNNGSTSASSGGYGYGSKESYGSNNYSSSSSSSSRGSSKQSLPAVSATQKAAFMAGFRENDATIATTKRDDGGGGRADGPTIGPERRDTVQGRTATTTTATKTNNNTTLSTGGTSSATMTGYANSTIGTPSLDNRDKMERMFAARKRKAQIEMIAAVENAAIGDKDSVRGENGGSSVDNAHRSGGRDADEDNYAPSTRESMASTTHTIQSKSSRSVGSTSGGSIPGSVGSKSAYSTVSQATQRTGASASSASYASRRALEMYLGTTTNSSVGTASVASLGTASVASVDRSGSLDSLDNVSAASKGVVGKLPPVKEESSHSLLGGSSRTVVTTNVSPNAKSVFREVGETSTSTANASTNGILRTSSSSLSKESRDGGGGGYRDDDNGGSISGKSVRFLSPLAKSVSNPQCSPPRSRVSRLQSDGSRTVAMEAEQSPMKQMEVPKAGEEDMEFALFVAGLKREVAGDHMEVRRMMVTFAL